MAFTDHSDLFGSVHEDGFNRVVRHLMRQRPSLFNYATAVFFERPELLCEKIEAAEKVVEAGNPLFTEVEPLPVPNTPIPVGLNFCLQLTNAEIDFHRGNQFDLPSELGPLGEQRFALRARGCAGIDCPSREVVDELAGGLEALLLAQQELLVGEVDDEKEKERAAGRGRSFATANVGISTTTIFPNFPQSDDTLVLPTGELLCFCLEIFAVGHFEWGEVVGSQQRWLKPRLDGIEIVDLEPRAMENALECYLATVVRLGILPRLIVPSEKMVLDLTALIGELGLKLGKQVSLLPAEVPADVPDNPAIEEDQVKVFLNLEVKDLEA